MRILVVSQYFWPESFCINDVVETLARKGIAVDVLTGQPNYPEGSVFPGYRAWNWGRERWRGAEVFRVPLAPRGSGGGFRLARNYFSFVASGSLFGPWLLRRRRYDAVLVYGVSPVLQAIPALLIGRLKRTPVAVWVQDLWPESLEATGYVRSRWVLSWTERVVRFIYQRADLLLVQSRAFEPRVGALAPGQAIVYHPNSIDDPLDVSAGVPAPEIPALDGGFPILFAGNVGTAQAVGVIVETAALLKDHPDIRFVVVGHGSCWDWMRREADARGLTNLHLAGRFPAETMPGLMRKASALLVTLADRPIFAATVPSKVQAYMAAGRPIVACLNGEGARLVDEAEAGLTAPAEDAAALAQVVMRLHAMTPAQRDRLGANGRSYYERNFDQDRLADRLIAHLRATAEAAR